MFGSAACKCTRPVILFFSPKHLRYLSIRSLISTIGRKLFLFPSLHCNLTTNYVLYIFLMTLSYLLSSRKPTTLVLLSHFNAHLVHPHHSFHITHGIFFGFVLHHITKLHNSIHSVLAYLSFCHCPLFERPISHSSKYPFNMPSSLFRLAFLISQFIVLELF